MNYQNAETLNRRIAATLRALAGVTGQLPVLEDTTRKIAARARQVEEDLFTLLVVGSFNRGKSTLLNAMMGIDVLPQEVIPATAVISVLRFGETPGATVHFHDSRPAESLSIEEFKTRYVLSAIETSPDLDVGLSEEDAARLAGDRFSHVDYAEVRSPLEFLRCRVQLVDSPGTEDDRARTHRSREFVGKADAIVYLLDSTQPVTQPDLDHLRWISSQGKTDMFFVANKWDIAERMARGDAEKLGRVTTRFRDKLAEFATLHGDDRFDRRFFRISALDALEAREKRPVDVPQLIGSGLPDLERALERFLTDDRVAVRKKAALADGLNYVHQVRATIEREESTLRQSVAQLERARVEIEPRLERLRGIVRHLGEYLSTRVEVIHSKVVDSLRTQMSAIDARKEVENFDLSELTDGWMVGKAVKDLGTDADNKLARRIERQVEPAVRKLLARERDQWERNFVSLTMRDESRKLKDYLEKEAELYQQALREIDQILGNESAEPVPVGELIDRWLDDTILGRHRISEIGVDNSSLATDFGPMIAGIAVEILLHGKFAFLTLGLSTVISVVLLAVRQKRMVENVKQDIAGGLQKGLLSIPTPGQSAEFRDKLSESFGKLREQVTRNMDAEIGQIETNLNLAIERHRQGEVDAESEIGRLDEIRTEASRHLAELTEICSTLS
ncbi:MAG TPA: dynamin family protein [Chthoniobacteraceae bacterium]|jgi:GTP-binding protein EngB required for normal cell division|nr:dynamin family protein [Chthoniobacteraceae bacterium]